MGQKEAKQANTKVVIGNTSWDTPDYKIMLRHPSAPLALCSSPGGQVFLTLQPAGSPSCTGFTGPRADRCWLSSPPFCAGRHAELQTHFSKGPPLGLFLHFTLQSHPGSFHFGSLFGPWFVRQNLACFVNLRHCYPSIHPCTPSTNRQEALLCARPFLRSWCPRAEPARGPALKLGRHGEADKKTET